MGFVLIDVDKIVYIYMYMYIVCMRDEATEITKLPLKAFLAITPDYLTTF